MTERDFGLKTKCIKEPREESDGVRISIMSLHKLSDGKTPDPEISCDIFDLWWRELAPPQALVGAWYRNEVSWNDFRKYYRLSLQLPDQQLALWGLIQLARRRKVAVMCIEKYERGQHCHRFELAEVIKTLAPDLPIEIM